MASLTGSAACFDELTPISPASSSSIGGCVIAFQGSLSMDRSQKRVILLRPILLSACPTVLLKVNDVVVILIISYSLGLLVL